MSADCIFCKIVSGAIPSKKIYEDEDFVAFHDINPSAKVHFLIVPKLHIESLQTCDASHQLLLGKALSLIHIFVTRGVRYFWSAWAGICMYVHARNDW